MNIVINDISFLKGFSDRYTADKALDEFGTLCLRMKKDEVSQVVPDRDIINSPVINKELPLASDYTLMDALKNMRLRDTDKFRFLISKLTQYSSGGEEEYKDEITIADISSIHCALYRNEIFISLQSSDTFSQETIEGILNSEKKVVLRNIADQEHIYTYWRELGFREYELNPKHGKREYIRAGGRFVGMAPETDELGQQLLNKVLSYKGRLFSVDTQRSNRIYEFRRSYANKYHGYCQNALTTDEEKTVLKLWNEIWARDDAAVEAGLGN